MRELTLNLQDAAATEALGGALAARLENGGMLFLQGDLGAGKTTLTRGLLRGLGHQGSVKSPTYTLVEPYGVAGRRVYHFDLYRLGDPEELELMGGRDYFEPGALCLVEWPERGAGFLPAADLVVHLTYAGEGRVARITAGSPAGEQILTSLADSLAPP